MCNYSIGLDYGTNSCRALVVNLQNGQELGSTVFQYPSGVMGVLEDPSNPHVARQNPQDYLDGCLVIVREALQMSAEMDPEFSADKVIGIGVDTTGSTVIPVDDSGVPLAMLEEFKDNLNAAVWLWKDHSSHSEATEITNLAKQIRPEYLAKCGGTYSSEWWWSKILHLQRVDPKVFDASYSFVEHCDWMTAELVGNTDPKTLKRSICAAGHKAMYSSAWGGLPDEGFLTALDPSLRLVDLRSRLYEQAYASDVEAGKLCAKWAKKLGLPENISIAVGAFDCHMGAVGSGVKPGTLVKVIGTSTCDITVVNHEVLDIPGLCGQVDSSVLPGLVGLEAGQSAVGDLFLWLVKHLVPEEYGVDLDEKFSALNEKLLDSKPGESGLLALDWNNGNRTILTDTQLSGMLVGQNLQTQVHEIYRAYIEATAFGAATIIRRMEEHGVEIKEVVNTGGISLKNPALMQIYADVMNKPMRVSAVDQTCALGAAIFAGVAAGYESVEVLQQRAVRYLDVVYEPSPENVAIYAKLYKLYRQLHDGFGKTGWSGTMDNVMKELLEIREQPLKSKVEMTMSDALKKQVVDANKRLVTAGLVTLTWGNVSAIEREKGLIAIKPSGVDYAELSVDNIVVVNLDGEVIEGDFLSSSDTKTHLELYRKFPDIGAVVHTHSPAATAFSQAGRELPCLGTTHADHFYGSVPIVRGLTPNEVTDDYEHFTGVSIVEHFQDHEVDPIEIPGVLLHHHAPFTWGKSAMKAVENSIALEACSKMAIDSFALNPELKAIPQHILDQHYLRKHGKDAYYGQR